MIMQRRLPKKMSRPQRLVLALAAGALLVVLPTWADRADDRSDELREQERLVAQEEAEFRQSMLALERQARELEHELQEVRTRQRELERDFARQHTEPEQERQLAEADLVRELKAEQAALQEEREAAVREFLLQEALQAEREAAEREILVQEDAARRAQKQQQQQEQRATDLAIDRLREEIELARKAGRDEQVAAMEHALQEVYLDSEIAPHHRDQEDALRAVRRDLEMMLRRLERIEAAGLSDRATELEHQIQELRRVIEEDRAGRQ